MNEPAHIYRRRRVAAASVLAAFCLLIVLVGDEHAAATTESAGAGTPTKPVVAQLPGGGRTIYPRKRVVAFYGAPQDDELGVLGIGSPARAAAAPQARLERLRDPRATGAARLRADLDDRQRPPRRRRHVPHPPVARDDRALPARRAQGQGAAAARRPARPGRLPLRGPAARALAASARRRPGARPRVARRRQRGPRSDDRLGDRRPGQRGRVVRLEPDDQARPARRSSSSSTSSPTG